MSDFHEILFPVDISYGSRGGPKWKTSVFQADSGFEARVSDWASTRAEYDVSHAIKFQDQMDRLTAFFYARRGRAYGFRFKDWNDHRAENITLGEGDWSTTVYQIIKHYDSAGPDGLPHRYDRPLKKIAWNSEVDVAVGGVVIDQDNIDPQFYAIDYNTGIVTLGAPMKGGIYTANAPETIFDFITTGEGGIATATLDRSTAAGGPPIDTARNRFYLRGQFNDTGAGTTRGLRVFNLTTSAETLQKRGSDMGITEAPITGIVAVSPVDGAIFVNVGTSNGQKLHKIDPVSYMTVANFGTLSGTLNLTNVSSLGQPGCVSLDGALLLHLPTSAGGVVGVHSTTTLARVATVITGSAICGSPFKSNGFAVLDHVTGDDRIKLYIYGGTTYLAAEFGGAAGTAIFCRYDDATGGLLIGWTEAAGQYWCGLWNDNVQGFVWKRRVPTLPTGQMDPQVALQGTLAWGANATTFGRHIFFLDTADGAITARPCSTNIGPHQTYNAAGKRLFSIGGANFVSYNLDLTGVTFTDPQKLTMDVVEFHVPVRFDTDHLNPKHEFWLTQSWDQISLVEVRDWNDVDLD